MMDTKKMCFHWRRGVLGVCMRAATRSLRASLILNRENAYLIEPSSDIFSSLRSPHLQEQPEEACPGARVQARVFRFVLRLCCLVVFRASIALSVHRSRLRSRRVRFCLLKAASACVSHFRLARDYFLSLLHKHYTTYAPFVHPNRLATAIFIAPL